MRGQGGVAVTYREELQKVITVCKKDAHKRYIWIKIATGGKPVFIAGCYIPHRESPFYSAFNVEKNNPFEDLYADINQYTQEGMVLLIGDMNARIAHAQMQMVDFMTTPEMEHKNDAIDPIWKRCSKDPMTNPQGVALLSMMTSLQLLALNGAQRFANSGECTCYTANKGMSAIDYVLVSYEASHIVHNLAIGDRSPSSDHTPLHVWLHIPARIEEKQPQPRSWTYKMQVDKKQAYAACLDRKLAHECMPSNIEDTWQIFKHALCEAVEETMGGKKYRKGKSRKGLPHNPWFDEECKTAKKQLRLTPQTANAWADLAKNYNTLKRRKRREYELHTETKAIANFKKNPKGEWLRMKGKRQDTIGDISPEDMYAYVEQLYVHEDAQGMPDMRHEIPIKEPFDFTTVTKGIKKLANGKAPDTLHLNSEMLKWSGNIAREWIHGLINKAITQGLPTDWQRNWIKALFKKGDVNQPTNYRTITVGSCMSKLLGSVLEQAISSWAETNGKRAIGQAGFRPKHSTIDHLISLRVLMEESRLKGKTLYCCFVDFTKAFDTVPRTGLWQRMESIGVPLHLRIAVAHLYQRVLCQLKTHAGMSKEFSSNMGVKQGCPLSPTLFGLCIDQIEDFIPQALAEEPDGPAIGMLTLLLLIYADDVALFAHDIVSLQKLVDAMHTFCENTGLSINVNKTKFMLVRTQKRQEIQPTLMYQEKQIERVDSFMYLGMDIPSNYAWGQCARNRIDVGHAKYYQLENMCTQKVIRRWEIKAIIFETCVVQAILYGVEIWGASISAHTWNEIEKIQKKFLCRHLGVKKTTPYSVLLLETGTRPLEMKALQRMLTYIMKVKLMPSTRIPHIAWKAGCALQKTKKSKLLTSSLIQDIRKWFAKWNVEAYADMPIVKGKEGECMLNFEIALRDCLHNKWRTTTHRSKFEYYCKHINTKYWELYRTSKPEAQVHIQTPMPHMARKAITLMRTRSHLLKIETGGWLKIDAQKRICTSCTMRALEDEAHVTLECPAYAHIRANFQQLIHGCHTLAELLSKTDPSPTALGTYLARILEHHKTLTEDTKKSHTSNTPSKEENV